MSHLIQGIVPAALLIFALSAGIQVAAGADKNLPARQGKFAAGNDKSSSSSLDKLCHNHYNELHLKVGKYEEIKAIIDRDKKASVQELTTILSAKCQVSPDNVPPIFGQDAPPTFGQNAPAGLELLQRSSWKGWAQSPTLIRKSSPPFGRTIF